MGGSWGTLVIGVKVDSFEEARQLFAKLGKNITIDEVRDNDYGVLLIEKWFNLSDHPLNPAHQKEYGWDAYEGDFQPHFNHELGWGWTEDKRGYGDLSDVVIGVQLFDSYKLTDMVPLAYISKKLEEFMEILPNAQVYLTHVHS